jgi:amphi-Trp domain-containing protein
VKFGGQRDVIIGYLESMVNSLKEGTLVIQENDRFISLKPKDVLTLEIECEQKEKKEELTIEISWRTEAKEVEEIPSDLVISSKEPEMDSFDADTAAM